MSLLMKKCFSHEEEVIIWCQVNYDKCILLDGKQKPCRRGLMRNGQKLVKDIQILQMLERIACRRHHEMC